MVKRAHVYIYGDVVGVGFRAWMRREAEVAGIVGWVKNADRECVEAVFEGEKDKVTRMIALCRKGPEVAWVKDVHTQWETPTVEFSTFEVKL